MLVFILDQASKWWVLNGLELAHKPRGSVAVMPTVNFTLVWNHAVTFGMFGGHAPELFMVVSLLACLVLLVLLWRSRSVLVSLACGAIMGGALGNVVDRWRYGAVEDFIHFHVGHWSWYVFNVADAFIVGGVGVWILASLLAERQHRA
ncbi:signal peptidase II [Formicincola oecophyllae]|uniref:signal peptidase II n=1 Tax=Formicincola oecophyllae TaxID=2558361 RepID=UPI0033130128